MAREEAARIHGIGVLGLLPLSGVNERVRRATMQLMPSAWYEVSSRVLIGALSVGLPVLVSRDGLLTERPAEGKPGILFEVGSAVDLTANVVWAAEHATEVVATSARARQEYRVSHIGEANCPMPLEIYASVQGRGPSTLHAAPPCGHHHDRSNRP